MPSCYGRCRRQRPSQSLTNYSSPSKSASSWTTCRCLSRIVNFFTKILRRVTWTCSSSGSSPQEAEHRWTGVKERAARHGCQAGQERRTATRFLDNFIFLLISLHLTLHFGSKMIMFVKYLEGCTEFSQMFSNANVSNNMQVIFGSLANKVFCLLLLQLKNDFT